MIIGVDYGLKRTGLAYTDADEVFAIADKPQIATSPTEHLQLLVAYIKSKRANKVIIGLPYGHNQQPTKQSQTTKEFGQTLQQTLPDIDVSYWNEFYTSQQAIQNLTAQKKSASIDSEAARIILQEYLDFNQTGI